MRWRREKEGARCPCCGLYNKVYKRKLNAIHGFCLIQFYRLSKTMKPETFIRVKDIDDVRFHRGGGEHAKLRFWEFLEKHPEEDSWRITPRGVRFVKGVTSTPKYVFVFDNEYQGFAGEWVRIQSVLGEKFDYEELMRGDANRG